MNRHFFHILSGLAVLAWLGAACTGSPITPTTTAEAAIAEIGKELEKVEMFADTGCLLWAQGEPVTIELEDDEWIYIPFAEELPASDFVIKSDITWESSGGLVTCGLFFRSEENFNGSKQYLYQMMRLPGLPGGEVVYLHYGDFHKDVSHVRTNSAIKWEQGSTNKVVIIAEGEKITVWINDIRSGSFYDYSKSMLEGYFAYSASQKSGESTCTFADTWVWSLK